MQEILDMYEMPTCANISLFTLILSMCYWFLGKNTNMKYYVKLSFIAKTKLAMEKVGLSYN